MGSSAASTKASGRVGRRRPATRRSAAAGLTLLLWAMTACTEQPGTGVLMGAGQGELGLAAFDDCDELLDAARTEADRAAEAWAGGPVARAADAAAAGAEVAASAAPSTTAPAASAPDDGTGGPGGWGGTNVQEEGVDEPDIVKVGASGPEGGERLLVRSASGLAAVDLGPDGPALVGALPLASGPAAQLLADGGRALVISGGGGPMPLTGDVAGTMPSSGPAPWEGTSLTVVDIADPASMAVVSTTELEGGLVSARLVDGVVRVVTTSWPGPVALPTEDADAEDTDVEDAGAAAIGAEDWLPQFRTLDADGREIDAGPLVPCDAVYRPVDADGREQVASTESAALPVETYQPGLATVTVTTLDLRAPAPRPDAGAAIMGAGEVVYASPSSLYVTSTEAILSESASAGAATAVHRFAIGGRGPAVYTGSGTVVGTVLDQFSLSEGPGGELRVATTQWATGPDQPSQSFVTVLAQSDGGLDEIGRIGGLGRTEQIRSVRFLGDVGYVVTFRQTDPLYVVDLRDPTAPVVTGELKIPGYSGYLHPLGPGRVLGVGQDATPEGRLLGLQVSVFDVSDPTAPTQVAVTTVPGTSALAEADHHAFLWSPEHALVVLPAQGTTADGGFAAGALVLGLEGDALADRGWLDHPVDPASAVGGYGAAIERALLVGEDLVTVSLAGVETTDPATLADRAWLPLG